MNIIKYAFPTNPIFALLQGLVYLRDQSLRPNFSDFLIITVRPVDQPDEVVAGAKIPASAFRLPLNFDMYPPNIIPGKEAKLDGDLFVRAEVCSTASVPCPKDEISMKADGISKIVKNLPGLPEGIEIRTAASLGLQENASQ
mmetsp:Transcript_33928/g.48189  ORF Transcript_33928/g.48189 Transcript_33928/m.48189 type:complete len:142 (-) Transcript_33928:1745-2170(-)